jgi:hypothetical protein
MMRLGQQKVPKKSIGHVDVVVLPGVDDRRLGPPAVVQGVVERRDFHEIRPGRGDEMDAFFHDQPLMTS